MDYDYLKIIKPIAKELKIGDLIKYKIDNKIKYGFYFRSISDEEIEVTSILNSFGAGKISKVKKINIIN